MKKFFIYALFCIVILAGCKKATYLKSDRETVTFAKEGGQDSLILHSDGADFKILSSPEWVESNLKDSVLYLKVPNNDSKSKREGNIVVMNGDQKLSLAISQASEATYFTISRKSVTLGQKGEPDTLRINTDGANPRLEGVEGVTTQFADGILTLAGKGNTGATKKTKAKLICDSLSVDLLVIEKGTKCSRCGGSGKVICSWCDGRGEVFCPYDICPKCHGGGRATCSECKGKGK